MPHELKTTAPHFQEQYAGRKTFELRLDDRGFICDDTLLLREYDPETCSYSGRWVKVWVDHILREHPGLEPRYVVMSTKYLSRSPDPTG